MMKSYLAIDYGEKFIGLATYKEGQDPFPLKWGRLQNKSKPYFFQEILTLVREEEISDLLFGVPKFTDGSLSKKSLAFTQLAQELNDHLAKLFPELKLHLWDETLTTFTAKERMKASAEFHFQVDLTQIDALCAQIMIEDFLLQKAQE
jgi:putative Holliday junction resolvase